MRKLLSVLVALGLLGVLASNASCGKVKRIVVQAPPDTVFVPQECPDDDD